MHRLAWSRAALTAVCCSLLAADGGAVVPDAGLAWRMHGEKSGVTAVALAPDGRLAVGDERGIRLRDRQGSPQEVALRGEVLDLAFLSGLPETTTTPLLAGTTAGLSIVSPEGRVQAVSPAPSGEARAIVRVATAEGVVAAATAGGVFVSTDARGWRRLTEQLPSGPVGALALRARGDVRECWVAISGELFRVDLHRRGDVWLPRPAVRVPLPFGAGSRSLVDLAFDAGADAVVVFDDALLVRDSVEGRFEVLRPTLPPGASIVRIEAGAGRVWLATDRGLLWAPGLRGSWRRASPPLGATPVHALVSDGDSLFAATARGLAIGRRERTAPRSAARGGPALIHDPPIERVHGAALDYLDLRPARVAALRRGLARRGWLPLVTLRASGDHDYSRTREYDEAFLSGDLRKLNDRDRDRSTNAGLQLTMTWDLGSLAYHPESIDVSREAREIIELRDDVLDEITQLYFERRSVLEQLAADPDEAGALRVRAEALAAGIDAWTGGWFGRELARRSSPALPDSGP